MRILHLYYDLMNLYGDSGNIKMLNKMLSDQKVKFVIDKKSIKDDIDFLLYDLVYIGTGTYKNQLLVLNHLKKYKNDINKYIKSNKFFICTGNSFELFGKYIIDNTTNIECLNIFDYYSKKIDERLVCEVFFEFKKNKIIGFQNQDSILINNSNHLFKVIDQMDLKNKDDYEGFNYKNFYGTYVTGPLLVRNIKFTKYLIKKLIKNYKDINYEVFNNANKNFIINILKKDLN